MATEKSSRKGTRRPGPARAPRAAVLSPLASRGVRSLPFAEGGQHDDGIVLPPLRSGGFRHSTPAESMYRWAVPKVHARRLERVRDRTGVPVARQLRRAVDEYLDQHGA